MQPFYKKCVLEMSYLSSFLSFLSHLFGVQQSIRRCTNHDECSSQKYLVGHIQAIKYIAVRAAAFTDECHALRYRTLVWFTE